MLFDVRPAISSARPTKRVFDYRAIVDSPAMCLSSLSVAARVRLDLFESVQGIHTEDQMIEPEASGLTYTNQREVALGTRQYRVEASREPVHPGA